MSAPSIVCSRPVSNGVSAAVAPMRCACGKRASRPSQSPSGRGSVHTSIASIWSARSDASDSGTCSSAFSRPHSEVHSPVRSRPSARISMPLFHRSFCAVHRPTAMRGAPRIVERNVTASLAGTAASAAACTGLEACASGTSAGGRAGASMPTRAWGGTDWVMCDTSEDSAARGRLLLSAKSNMWSSVHVRSL